MSARRIARELAVILLPQLPKDKAKLESIEIDALASKAVAMLCDYGKENLAEVDALITKISNDLMTTEIEHPTNVRSIAQLLPVTLSTEQVKEQLDNLKRALNLINEAIDIPALALQSHPGSVDMVCQHCQKTNTFVSPGLDKSEVKEFLIHLVNAYSEHRQEIDDFIRHAKAKWQIERMVSIDRDILRLACAEAFYMPDIPIAVVINEAVELCHRFADEKAAKFINGILADLDKDAEYFRQHGTFPEKIPVDDTAGNLGAGN